MCAAGIFSAAFLFGQDSTSNKVHNRKVAIASAATYGVSLIGLNQLWYADYERSNFHFFNDNNNWMKMDKFGHSYSTYALTSLTYDMYKSDNRQERNNALLYAGGSAFLFLTTIEIFDGFSSNWGFSSGDFISNTAGIGLFVGQELLFNDQIVRIKYSFLNTKFRKLRPNTFGETTLESAFKDYNGQTYWASFNLNSISKQIEPKWLNFAFGYGADDMIFGSPEVTVFEGVEYTPYRSYYLSLDVDWSKIPTNRKVLKWMFRVANCIKLPAPTFQLSEKNKPEFHWIYF